MALNVIQVSAATVKSIELQLVRVETVKHPDSGKVVREATEIQNIQIGDGDITRNLVIPMYMVSWQAASLSWPPLVCTSTFFLQMLLCARPGLSATFHVPHDDHRAVQGRI